MSATSANMSLTIWNLSSDLYDHAELAANLTAIDAHDHTSGKGVQVPTGGIANLAITTGKIADDAITNAKIAAGAVTATELDTAYVHPIGKVILWWRPNNATAIPAGWVPCTGQTLTAADHDFAGGGSITLPNLVNAFALGADIANTGSLPSTPPAIGQTGGAHTKNLTHSHAVNGHTHTINGHSHTVNAHSHTVAAHDHGAGSLDTDKAAVRDDKLKTDSNSATRANTVTSAGDDGHKHSVTGRTGTASPATDSQSPGTSSVALTTNSAGSTTDTQLSGTFDIRPNYVGLLFLMKVKLG